MNVPESMAQHVRTIARSAVLTGTLALAACQTDGDGPSAVSTPKPEAAPVAAAARPETPQTQGARPAEPAADREPMTRARAALTAETL